MPALNPADINLADINLNDAAGKEVTKDKTVHPSGETDYEKTSTDTFGETRTGLAKTDFGLSSGVGVEYKRFVLGVNYEPGLINIGGDYRD